MLALVNWGGVHLIPLQAVHFKVIRVVHFILIHPVHLKVIWTVHLKCRNHKPMTRKRGRPAKAKVEKQEL